jgi:hypothetical protein
MLELCSGEISEIQVASERVHEKKMESCKIRRDFDTCVRKWVNDNRNATREQRNEKSEELKNYCNGKVDHTQIRLLPVAFESDEKEDEKSE